MLQHIIVEEKLHSFIKARCNSRCSLLLLMFLAKHPHTRFSQLAVVNAVGSRRPEVERALRNLQEGGLVMMWKSENGLALYSLTDDEAMSKQVLDLIPLDWWQYQMMLDEL